MILHRTNQHPVVVHMANIHEESAPSIPSESKQFALLRTSIHFVGVVQVSTMNPLRSNDGRWTTAVILQAGDAGYPEKILFRAAQFEASVQPIAP